jgi:hypothetical protein
MLPHAEFVDLELRFNVQRIRKCRKKENAAKRICEKKTECN